MSLEEVLAKHLLPRLDATKTACLKYRGQITQKFLAPDWSAALDRLDWLSNLAVPTQRSKVMSARSFDRTLSQLERLQRMRLGQPVLPKPEVRQLLSRGERIGISRESALQHTLSGLRRARQAGPRQESRHEG